MLKRCYNTSEIRYYSGVEVEKSWHNFQNFAGWASSTKPKEGTYVLDKDSSGTHVYSAETCNWIPPRINGLINYPRDSELPLGVSKNGSNYQALCNDANYKLQYLGTFTSPEQAHKVYKEFKKTVLISMANDYYAKGLITEKVRDLLHTFDVGRR